MRRDISWVGTNFRLVPNTAHGRNRHSAAAVAADAAAGFPNRPPPGVLNESIPLFFISRDKSGFWIARESKRTTGGIFLFKRSALRFAERNSIPSGCAMMFLAAPRELDVDNRGNPLVAAAARCVAAWHAFKQGAYVAGAGALRKPWCQRLTSRRARALIAGRKFS